MGTGDGGMLAGLGPPPPLIGAYEEWLPTVDTAVATLRPLGVHVVVALGSDDNTTVERTRPGLPFAHEAFEIVLNRHEAFDAIEVRRIARPGGTFVTQQVGSDEAASVRVLLGLETNEPAWDASVSAAQLVDAGWIVNDVREERPSVRFTFAQPGRPHSRFRDSRQPDRGMGRRTPRSGGAAAEPVASPGPLAFWARLRPPPVASSRSTRCRRPARHERTLSAFATAGR